MALPDVELDNRGYLDLVNELKRRIPAYTPEWTDYNESDPGIALIELFSWLADILIYRINQIPDKAYVKFLQMLNIQLALPAAAQAYLTFTLTSQDLPQAVVIGAGIQVGLSNAAAGPVIFETTADLPAVGAGLAAVQTYDGAVYSVVNNFNPMDGSSYYAFSAVSAAPQQNAALYMGFDRAFPASGTNGPNYPITILVSTPSVSGSGQATQSTQNISPPIQAALEYSTASGWGSINLVSDGTNNLTQTGVIVFQAPADWAAVQRGALRKTSDPALYWLRFRINQVLGRGYQSPPQLTNILVNTVMALNAVTEQGEVLGASNFMPNQTFQISHAPLLPKPASVTGIVQVDEGDGNGPTTWKEVADFDTSGPNDKVYTLDYISGIVTFGDGEHGKIPYWLSGDGSNLTTADQDNIWVTQYQWGGGAAGNAGSNTITTLIDTVPYVASVTNLLPSSLGADAETVAEAEARVPQEIKTRSRAVTPDDFVYLAVKTPGARIQRATAIPLQLPQTQVVRAADGTVITPPPAPGVVTVIVVPDGPDPQMPVANDQTQSAVAAYLDQYRLVTCELHVTTPVYRKVEIRANVTVEPAAISGDVQTVLQKALLAFYNPLSGGQQGTGWEFGGTISVSDAYRQILNVTGVVRIEGSIDIFVDDKMQSQGEDIALQPFELVYSKNHTLNVSYSQ